MLNTLLRFTALSIVAQLLTKRRNAHRQEALSASEFTRLYGTPGEEYLKRMGTYDFAPGALDEMMAAIDAAFEREPEHE